MPYGLQRMANMCYTVSIPQAVSTVATLNLLKKMHYALESFNTASGKHCCNLDHPLFKNYFVRVSIPQAVSTVATGKLKTPRSINGVPFQYRKR